MKDKHPYGSLGLGLLGLRGTDFFFNDFYRGHPRLAPFINVPLSKEALKEDHAPTKVVKLSPEILRRCQEVLLGA